MQDIKKEIKNILKIYWNKERETIFKVWDYKYNIYFDWILNLYISKDNKYIIHIVFYKNKNKNENEDIDICFSDKFFTKEEVLDFLDIIKNNINF